jgi:hypothetical protein
MALPSRPLLQWADGELAAAQGGDRFGNRERAWDRRAVRDAELEGAAPDGDTIRGSMGVPSEW